jgi:hypothetical protein
VSGGRERESGWIDGWMGGGRRPEREEKKGCVQGATEIYESRERELLECVVI